MLRSFLTDCIRRVEKVVRLKLRCRKNALGLLSTAASFFLVAMIQTRIDGGARPSNHLAGLGVRDPDCRRTLVSPTHLEFSYTQGPVKLKSLVMCTYLLAVSLGNQFTAAVNFFIQNPDGSVKLQGTSYFMFFVWVCWERQFYSRSSHRLQRPNLFTGSIAVIGDAEPAVGFAVQPEA